MLANDIQAHQSSVDTLNDTGRQLIETERGSAEASTQERLNKLNNQWRELLRKAADRKHELEEIGIAASVAVDEDDASRSSTPNSLFDDGEAGFNGWQSHDWKPTAPHESSSILDRRQYIQDSPIQPQREEFTSKMLIQKKITFDSISNFYFQFQ